MTCFVSEWKLSLAHWPIVVTSIIYILCDGREEWAFFITEKNLVSIHEEGEALKKDYQDQHMPYLQAWGLDLLYIWKIVILHPQGKDCGYAWCDLLPRGYLPFPPWINWLIYQVQEVNTHKTFQNWADLKQAENSNMCPRDLHWIFIGLDQVWPLSPHLNLIGVELSAWEELN